MKRYTADFETATWLKDETYVWAWAICEIGNPDNILIGGDIDEFMEWCKKNYNSTLYFHNLRCQSLTENLLFGIYLIMDMNILKIEKIKKIKLLQL